MDQIDLIGLQRKHESEETSFILDYTRRTRDLCVNEYLNEIKSTFNPREQIFLDTSFYQLTCLKTLNFLLRNNVLKKANKALQFMQKCVGYTLEVEKLVTRERNIVAPIYIIDEMVGHKKGYESLIKNNCDIPNHGVEKSSLCGIKTNLREVSYGINRITTILYNRLNEHKRSFKEYSRTKIKKEIDKLFPEEEVSNEDKDLVGLALEQAVQRPSRIISRDPITASLIDILEENMQDLRKSLNNRGVNIRIALSPNPIFTVNALFYVN